MTSAASARASIASMSGAIASNRGSMPKRRAHRTRSRPTDVRELVSVAIARTSPIGRRVNSATEATGPHEASDTPGTIR